MPHWENASCNRTFSAATSVACIRVRGSPLPPDDLADGLDHPPRVAGVNPPVQLLRTSKPSPENATDRPDIAP